MRSLYLVGPTGSGKSSLASLIANDLNGEIINADAFQLYKGIEIITASPNKKELARAPHHLYGILNLDEESNAGKYSIIAKEKIKEIKENEKLPIVTGGSGLYIKSLTHGLLDFPPVDEKLRKRLDQLSIEELTQKLFKFDPDGAQNINLKNKRHVIRALEISIQCGKPMSQMKKDWKKKNPVFTGLIIERPRNELYERINSRVIEMFNSGAVEQIEQLPTNISETAIKAIGIREIKDYLDGKMSLDESISTIQKISRNYAKRQITWFKRESGFQRVCLNADEDTDLILKKILGTISSMKNVI